MRPQSLLPESCSGGFSAAGLGSLMFGRILTRGSWLGRLGQAVQSQLLLPGECRSDLIPGDTPLWLCHYLWSPQACRRGL